MPKRNKIEKSNQKVDLKELRKLKKNFLILLDKDEDFRHEVRGILGYKDIIDEIRTLRKDFNEFVKLSEKHWEENNKRWKENEKRWQENNKKWEENEKRWQENQEELRKLREDLNNLRKDFNEFVKLSEKRWEENQKRWEENEKRWQENEKRWQEADRKFKWIMTALEDIRDAIGGGFEYYTARVVKLILKERGFESYVRANVNLRIDGKYKEVDIFCDEPLVIGEVKVKLSSQEEMLEKLDKLEEVGKWLKESTGSDIYMKVFAVEFISSDLLKVLQDEAEKRNIYLIVGREIEKIEVLI